ncbi:MAG: hypothetical protein ABH834_05755 [Candidatus Altiarchaeota archaeon]
MAVKGWAYFNNDPANGKTVKAFVAGQVRGEAEVIDGRYYLSMSGSDGELVYFTIDGCPADKNTTYKPFETESINLYAACLPTTSTTSTTSTSTTSTTSVYTTSTSSTSSSTTTTSTSSSSTTTTSSSTTTLPWEMHCLYITEFVPVSENEFIELYNTNYVDVSLDDFAIGISSVPQAEPATIINLSGVISPHTFHAVYQNETGFDIPDSWGTIYLYNRDFVCDSVSYNVTDFNPQWIVFPQGLSVGRATGRWVTPPSSTPGAPNPLVYLRQVSLSQGWNMISLPLNP